MATAPLEIQLACLFLNAVASQPAALLEITQIIGREWLKRIGQCGLDRSHVGVGFLDGDRSAVAGTVRRHARQILAADQPVQPVLPEAALVCSYVS